MYWSGPEPEAAAAVDTGRCGRSLARSGVVTGVATLLSAGRTMVSYDVVVSDDAGRRCCTARITCLLRDQAPGAAT